MAVTSCRCGYGRRSSVATEVTLKPISRRTLLATGAATAFLEALPAAARNTPKPLVLDDASRLNAVRVARHWRPQGITGEAWLGALRAELEAAAAEGRPVSVGAARHSMGGQSLARDGVAMTFDVTPAACPAPAGR